MFLPASKSWKSNSNGCQLNHVTYGWRCFNMTLAGGSWNINICLDIWYIYVRIYIYLNIYVYIEHISILFPNPQLTICIVFRWISIFIWILHLSLRSLVGFSALKARLTVQFVWVSNPPRSLPFPPSQQGVAKVVGVSTSWTVTKRTKAETEKKGRRFEVLGGLKEIHFPNGKNYHVKTTKATETPSQETLNTWKHKKGCVS